MGKGKMGGHWSSEEERKVSTVREIERKQESVSKMRRDRRTMDARFLREHVNDFSAAASDFRAEKHHVPYPWEGSQR